MIIASFLIGSGAGVAGLGVVWLALTLWFRWTDRAPEEARRDWTGEPK